MISVLLIILKIIGIILLVTVGLVLLMLLLVLFVPVRYRAEGGYEEAFRCKAKVTWLLHLISIKVHVEEEVTTSIRVLGIPLSVFLKKKETAANQNKGTDLSDSDKPSEASKTATDKVSTSVRGDHNVADAEQSVGVKETIEQTQTSELSDEERKSFFDKIRDRIDGIIEKIKDILNKIRDIFAKIKDFNKDIEGKKKTLKRYLRILQSDTVKNSFAVCKKRLFIMLKHILPRKMLVNVRYGLTDPANTGYILGVYGVLPAFIGERIVLHPDFDNQVFQCDFHMKGAIRIWTLLYQLLRVILDKNCRKLYYIVKKEISNERK